jgi:hypothetical protein
LYAIYILFEAHLVTFFKHFSRDFIKFNKQVPGKERESLAIDFRPGGSELDCIEVEIINWSRYNPRRDYKRPVWFALSNRILENPSFFDFAADEFKAWIYILCQASQKNSACISLNFRHADKVCSISKRALLSTIDKLEKAESIQRHVQMTNVICTDDERATNATLQDNTIHNKTNNNAHAEAFADFWSGYPRKQGKSGAEKKYRSAIKVGATHEEICKARDRYTEHLRREGIESKFILHGSTFMTQWRDWLDPEAGSAESFAAACDPAYETLEQAFARREREAGGVA